MDGLKRTNLLKLEAERGAKDDAEQGKEAQAQTNIMWERKERLLHGRDEYGFNRARYDGVGYEPEGDDASGRD